MIKIRIPRKLLSELFKKGAILNDCVCTEGIPDNATLSHSEVTEYTLDLYFKEKADRIVDKDIIVRKNT